MTAIRLAQVGGCDARPADAMAALIHSGHLVVRRLTQRETTAREVDLMFRAARRRPTGPDRCSAERWRIATGFPRDHAVEVLARVQRAGTHSEHPPVVPHHVVRRIQMRGEHQRLTADSAWIAANRRGGPSILRKASAAGWPTRITRISQRDRSAQVHGPHAPPVVAMTDRSPHGRGGWFAS